MNTLDEKTTNMVNGLVNSGKNIQDILIKLSELMREYQNGE